MKVTVEQLRAKRACTDQVKVFEQEWPDGVEITLEVLQRAVELELDLDWFACRFLPAPALEAYHKATAPAWKAFQEARAPAWKAYHKAIAPTWEAYNKAMASALYQVIIDYHL